jgi:hypothetical protein
VKFCRIIKLINKLLINGAAVVQLIIRSLIVIYINLTQVTESYNKVFKKKSLATWLLLLIKVNMPKAKKKKKTFTCIESRDI